MVMATKSGIIKKTELSQYSNIRKSGLIAVELREDDALIGAAIINKDQDILLATRKGMSIRFSESDVRPTGRSSIGVKGITLKEGDYVIGMGICDAETEVLIVTEKGFGKRTRTEEYGKQSRGGKGIMTYRISEKTGELVSLLMVKDEDDIMLITSEGVVIRIHADGISTIGRATSGVTLMKTTENNYIVAAAKTHREEEVEESTEENIEEEQEVPEIAVEGEQTE